VEGDVAESDNTRAYRRFILEGVAGGDLEVIDELVSPVLREHHVGIRPSDRDGFKQTIGLIHEAFATFTCAIDDVAAHGDMVWARLTATGTNRREVIGQPPTGLLLSVTGLEACRFCNGRIVEHWGLVDMYDALRRIGVVPRPPARRRALGDESLDLPEGPLDWAS
jgi:predicted ester cyclase